MKNKNAIKSIEPRNILMLDMNKLGIRDKKSRISIKKKIKSIPDNHDFS